MEPAPTTKVAPLSLDNQYKGYEPPAGVVTPIDRISADIAPEVFFDKYVAHRRPVIIQGHLPDPKWRGKQWTNRYLYSKAGYADVIVERRGQEKDATFGLKAPKVNMTYGDFVTNLMEGNDRLYLTTQDLERFEDDLDDFDMPRSVLAEPLKSLKGDFPIQPALLGHLIPYQLSVWQGIGQNGSSSGLHHDYHDNLYILIRGRKRFRLFPPSAGPHMQTAGILAKIHTNGLIVYRNKPDDPVIPVRADGVPKAFLARQKKDDAELELAEIEEALENLQNSDVPETEKTTERLRLEQKIEQCEQRIDEAMEEIIEFGCPGDMGSDDEDSDDDLPVELALPAALNKPHQTNGNGHSHCQEHKESPPAKRLKTHDTDNVNQESASAGDPQHTDDNSEARQLAHLQQASYLERKMPDHFCDMKFNTETDSPSDLFKEHPDLTNVGCMVTDVNPGEMLYLPASWFHEVTSYSVPAAPPESEGFPIDSSKDRGHLAFNYWSYPPDNDVFEQPYKDSFWTRRWLAIQKFYLEQREWQQQEQQIHIHSDVSSDED